MGNAYIIISGKRNDSIVEYYLDGFLVTADTFKRYVSG